MAMALLPAAAVAQETAPPDVGEIITLELRVPLVSLNLHAPAGQVRVRMQQIAQGYGVAIRIERGISPKGAVAATNANGDVAIRFRGGARVLLQGFGQTRGLVVLRFADGTDWGRDDIRKLADMGAPDNRMLYGTGGDEFDPGGFARRIVGHGGGDVVHYRAGYGPLVIDERDETGADADSTLQLGSGITPGRTGVSATARGDIVLSFGHGDVITMPGALVRDDAVARGLQTIVFADGTRWTIGDLRYRLRPGPWGMRIARPDDPEAKKAVSIDVDRLDGKGWASGSFGFADTHGDAMHNATLGTVKASRPLPASLTPDVLRGFFQATIGEEASHGQWGDINWRFSAPGAFDFLAVGQSVTLSCPILISDRQGGDLPPEKSLNLM